MMFTCRESLGRNMGEIRDVLCDDTYASSAAAARTSESDLPPSPRSSTVTASIPSLRKRRAHGERSRWEFDALL
jgi:hypothetical protein